MSGFQHAPTTKTCILTTASLSLVLALADIKQYAHVQWVPHMRTHHQYWRLLVHPLAFTNSVDLLMAIMAFYNLGIHVERAFGTRKFTSFLILASVFSTLASFLLVVLLAPWTVLNVVPAGSFAVLGAIWWQYHRMVPVLYTVNVFGVRLSNKVTTYLYPFFLLLHQFPSSAIAFFPGIIFSILYNSSPTLPHFRLPQPLTQIASRLLHPLIDPQSSAPPRRADRVLPGEISESAAQSVARLWELERVVRGAEEREAATRRRVGEEVAVRRQRLVGVLQGLQAVQAQAAQEQAARERESEVAAPAATTTTTTTTQRNPFLGARPSRFGLGGWVDRAGEAVGIRSTSGGEGMMSGVGAGAGTEGAGTSGESTPRGAPSQAEIDSVVGMFPNLSRDAVVRALQRSNYNTALAVELLLEDST
ncbi:hypothetical protein NliqN6_0450 [Naganishia liquefaciens]|uniref:CUE domain-containing protein n=1 Tax=Naganishia liquefaciens TaxID=104408 RepID=A0A8H3TNJ2_9TREE|nr:hypothetical protein NliqN6_0450 [Naganishia liquefaciens]